MCALVFHSLEGFGTLFDAAISAKDCFEASEPKTWLSRFFKSCQMHANLKTPFKNQRKWFFVACTLKLQLSLILGWLKTVPACFKSNTCVRLSYRHWKDWQTWGTLDITLAVKCQTSSLNSLKIQDSSTFHNSCQNIQPVC